MRNIFVPGAGRILFPDDMSDEDIQNSIEKDILPQVEGAQVGPPDTGVRGTNVDPERAGWAPTALRIGGAVIGATAGALLPIPGGTYLGGLSGATLGGVLGGSVGQLGGDLAAQTLEINRHARGAYNPGRGFVEGLFGAAAGLGPGVKLAESLGLNIAKHVGAGALIGGALTGATEFAEEGRVSPWTVPVGAVVGGALSGVLGGSMRYYQGGQEQVGPVLSEVAQRAARRDALMAAQEADYQAGLLPKNVESPKTSYLGPEAPIIISSEMDQVAGGKTSTAALQNTSKVISREPLAAHPYDILQPTQPRPLISLEQIKAESDQARAGSRLGTILAPTNDTVISSPQSRINASISPKTAHEEAALNVGKTEERALLGKIQAIGYNKYEANQILADNQGTLQVARENVRQERTIGQALAAQEAQQQLAQGIEQATTKGGPPQVIPQVIPTTLPKLAPDIPKLAIKQDDTLSDFIGKWGGLSPDVAGYAPEGSFDGLISKDAPRALDKIANLAFQAGYIDSPDIEQLVGAATRDYMGAVTGGERVLGREAKAIAEGQLAPAGHEAQVAASVQARQIAIETLRPAEMADSELWRIQEELKQEPQPFYRSEASGFHLGEPTLPQYPSGPASPGELIQQSRVAREQLAAANKVLAGQPSVGETLMASRAKTDAEMRLRIINPGVTAIAEALKGEKGAAPLLTEVPAAIGQKVSGAVENVREFNRRLFIATTTQLKTSGQDIATLIAPDGTSSQIKFTGVLADKILRHEKIVERDAGRPVYQLDQMWNQLTSKEHINIQNVSDGRMPVETLTARELAGYKIRKGFYDEVRTIARLKGAEGEMMTIRANPETGEKLLTPFIGYENGYAPRWHKPEMYEENSALRKEAVTFIADKYGWEQSQAADWLRKGLATAKLRARQFSSLDWGRDGPELPQHFYALQDNPQAMDRIYFDRAYHRLHWINEFGPNSEIAQQLLDSAALYDPHQAEYGRTIFNKYGGLESQDRYGQAALNLFHGFETITKFSPATSLGNLSQMLGAAYRTSVWSTFQAVKSYKTSEEMAGWAGQLLRGARMQAYQAFEAGLPDRTTIADRYRSLIQWERLDKAARVVGAGAGRFYADNLVDKILDNPSSLRRAFWTRRLEGLGVNVDNMLRLKAEARSVPGPLPEGYLNELVKAAQTVSTDVNFRNSVPELPFFNNTYMGKIFLLWRSFNLNNTKFLWQHVYKELAQGNPRPMATLAVAGLLGGEVIADLKALVTFRDPRDQGGMIAQYAGGRAPTFQSVMRNYIQASSFGMFEDLYDVSQIKKGGFGALSNRLVGPIITDTTAVAEAINTAYHQGSAGPLTDMLKRRFIPGGATGRSVLQAYDKYTTTPTDTDLLWKAEQAMKIPTPPQKSRRETIRRRRALGYYQ